MPTSALAGDPLYNMLPVSKRRTRFRCNAAAKQVEHVASRPRTGLTYGHPAPETLNSKLKTMSAYARQDTGIPVAPHASSQRGERLR